ncbi:hypothetical protein Tco_1082549 [Tanacetum coccineum]|uniref:Uncharacterized protein n=1 Tax=Tanacetum coccineum TaxID=301880 RepID=A0ABQ5I1Z9_9ASTR
MSKTPKSIRGQSSTSPEISLEEKIRRFRVFENGVHQLNNDTLEFLAYQNLDQAFFDSISIDPFSWPQWGNLLCMNEPIYRELVREFFASFKFEASACRVELYTKRKSRDNATLSGLSRAKTVKESHLLMEFWPSIGDGGFNVGNTKVASIRNPRVKLAHRCIATTIARRKETTHRFTEIDLYYLYSVEEVEEAEEEAEGEAVNEGASGFAKMYRNMSQGDWQVIFDEKKLETLGWHLEEIHVTWAHLEKKRTRLRLYTKSFEESSDTKAWRRRLDLLMRDVMDLADGVRT